MGTTDKLAGDPRTEEADPEIEVEVDVIVTGSVKVRMRRSQARELARKLDTGHGQVDLDEVPGFDWAKAIDAMDGVAEEIQFDDELPEGGEPGGGG